MKYSLDDLLFALGNAAEFLRNEEWPGEDAKQQHEANRAAAKMIDTLQKQVTKRRQK